MQVGPPSLLEEQQASLPESQASPEMQTSGDTAAQDSPLSADPSDSSDSEVENDGPAADGEERERHCARMMRMHVGLTAVPLKSQSWGRAWQVCCSANTAGRKATLTRLWDPNASAPWHVSEGKWTAHTPPQIWWTCVTLPTQSL